MPKPSPKVVSLFSGCGGLDLGLQQAGFSVAFATDNEPLCEQSHRKNFPSTAFFCGSVEDVTADLVESETGLGKGDVALLAGGPPCPPFSKSRFYRTEKKRGLEDTSGQTTIRGYLRLLDELRPSAFLLENVAGFAYKKHRAALDLILAEAEGLGYCCDFSILNAADFGVPQIRERFFLIGIQGRRPEFPNPTHSKDGNADLFASQLLPWVTAGEVLSDLDTEENASHEGHFAGGKHHHLLEAIPEGENYLFYTEERGHPDPIFKWRSRYWSFLLKLSREKPSWTIQARRSNNMGPLHWRNRMLRIEEVKRLQSFPDSWHLAGTVEAQWRQIGNAVPPPLAKALGESILNNLNALQSAC